LKAAGLENCNQSTVQYPSVDAPHEVPKYSSSVITTQYFPAGGLTPATEPLISEYELPPARSWVGLKAPGPTKLAGKRPMTWPLMFPPAKDELTAQRVALREPVYGPVFALNEY
jgi:hypothetical protein